MLKKIVYSVIILIIVQVQVFAEKAPIKFGRVSIEDLSMTRYDPDTSAAAVILCDYGIWDNVSFQFTRVVRYKILKPEGLDFADKIFPGYEKTAVRGKTFNLENGEIVETKLKNESIIRERIYDDYYQLRISMPNVKVGSVFDLEFVSSWIPTEWYFQQTIPVKWSELYIPTSVYFDYRKNFYGYAPLFLSESDHWIGKDMPAFKEEPFTNSIENYITKYEFELLSINIPGYYKDFTTNWNAVAKRLDESDYFGGLITPSLYLNSLANKIKVSCTTDLAKITAAYDSIKMIKWNEHVTMWASTNNLMGIYKDRVGNSAEINFILLNLLRKLDIDCYPVVMSTRANGLLPPFYPSLYKINYMIVYAKVNDKEYLMDASDKYAPFGLLPFRCLNYYGQRINKDIASQVNIKANSKDKETHLFNLEITDDLKLIGTVNSSYSDYGAYNFRKEYSDFNSQEEYVEDIESDEPGLKIKSLTLNNLDSIYFPVKRLMEIESSSLIYEIDGKIYINPMTLSQIKENPFKNDTRKYPVDYGYCRETNYIARIKIPAGYQIETMPKPLVMELPEKSARVTYQIAADQNQITINYKFLINKEQFLGVEYPNLKELYNQIIKKQAEPVILKKI